ncbi:MAG: hypothetical protein HGA54_07955 [Actinobacteria bacterium]|nr:hypothetical protein [Actinomycetota bacterium]
MMIGEAIAVLVIALAALLIFLHIKARVSGKSGVFSCAGCKGCAGEKGCSGCTGTEPDDRCHVDRKNL